MSLYMDVHIIPGIKAMDVAEAHRKDVQLQEEHHCKCMTYWIDEERENVFCLIDAPDKEYVVAMLHKAHGLVPNNIIKEHAQKDGFPANSIVEVSEIISPATATAN